MMIELHIKEIHDDDSAEKVVVTEVLRATIPRKLAAATLRAYADELDPPRPVMRGGQ